MNDSTTYEQDVQQALFAMLQSARHTLSQRPRDAARADMRRRGWAESGRRKAGTPERAEVARIIRDADAGAWFDLCSWYGDERTHDALRSYSLSFARMHGGSCLAPAPACTMDWRTARNDERVPLC